MDTMELERWYSLDECTNRKLVLKQLKDLQKEGKIDFDLDKSTDVFEIEDLDLEDSDIEGLIELFDEHDVFPYLDKDEDEDEDEDYGYYDDESDEY
jgi:hypothetical protein